MKNDFVFILFLFMALPFFYTDQIKPGTQESVLNEETSRHVVQVLRMTTGEPINLTDGKGNLYTTQIIEAHKRKTTVKILSDIQQPVGEKKICIGISLVKNASRFEWFLEKATEIGVNGIYPILCERTEKQNFRLDRMKSILISAMLQSQQTWLPVLHEPVKLVKMLRMEFEGQKFIAHCEDGNEKQDLSTNVRSALSKLVLIGPEGDFTKAEITEALVNNYTPVTLGQTRLRTETAGLVAITLMSAF
ncbi:MAG: RsmE family RNA methyltransferase [Ferruginibacter sp.]